MRDSLRRAWGRVRWRIAAIVVFTGTSSILILCLTIAALNVMVRRESANVVEKQIQMLVQASRSVAPAILDHAGACTASPSDSGGLKPLFAYTDEAFPQAQASLIVEDLSPSWPSGSLLAASMAVTTVSPRPFRMHSPSQGCCEIA